MLVKKLIILMMCLIVLTGSGCFLQPVEKETQKFNFIDLDAPALRLAHPIEGELLEKLNGKWESIGTGVIPAGAYIKGRSPIGLESVNDE